jgi:hypothetical protein
MVSVDRAEMPAAGWIGPGIRPCTVADVVWGDRGRCLLVQVEALSRQTAAQAGCRLPYLRPRRRAHVHGPQACTVPFMAGGTVVHRPDARQRTERITLSDREVLESARRPLRERILGPEHPATLADPARARPLDRQGGRCPSTV